MHSNLTPPNDKFVDQSRWKACEDDKIDATQKMKYVIGRVRNKLSLGQNADYQIFLLVPQCVQKLSFSGSLKVF